MNVRKVLCLRGLAVETGESTWLTTGLRITSVIHGVAKPKPVDTGHVLLSS